MLCCGFILATAAVRYKNYRYLSVQGHLPISFNGTGTILAFHGQSRYVFRDSQGRRLLYYSPKVHPIGTILFSTASLEAGTGGVDIVDKFSPTAVYSKLQQFSASERGFDKAKWLLMKGRVGVMYERNAIVLGREELSRVDKMRVGLASYLAQSYANKTSALTLGMLVGDRSELSKEEYQSFVDSGLVHIIAVSGGNIALILSFLSAILFFVPYYLRLLITVGVVVGYALLCGMDSSVIRATVMALLSILALFSGRILSVRRSMGIVYITMLLRNPYFLVYDLGFIFSFSALSGLVFFAGRRSLLVRKKLSLRGIIHRFWNIYLLPSIAASLGIMAPLLFFTGRVNLLSILSNIAIVPLIPFIMIYGFFVTLLYSVTSRGRITWPQERAVGRIYKVNNRANMYAVTLTTQTGQTRIVILFLAIMIVSTYLVYKHLRKDKRMV